VRRTASLLLLLAATPATAQGPQPRTDPTAWQRAVAAGYKAAMLCSGVFNAGRTEAQVDADELKGIYSEYAPIVPTLKAVVDRRTATVTVPFAQGLPPRLATWRPGLGCTTAPIGAAVPRAAQTYPTMPGPARADPRPWPLGDAGIRPRPSQALSAAMSRAFDRRTYGQGETLGVVLLRDGKVVAERYRQGFGPFTSNRTWSVAKSIAGTLVGMAVHEGQLKAASAALLPEWSNAGDPRGAITLDNLLRMASGLHSDTAGNRTDAIYFGGSTVDQETVQWGLEATPGTRFRYANNDILLAVLAARRATQNLTPQGALFGPLGMRHSVAEQDWRGNYVLSSQVWSTARDLARLGQFWLQDGVWQGKRLLPEGWVRYMTTPSGPQPPSGPGYGATLWLFGAAQGLPAGSYAAQGNRGQYVMVVPSERLVVVRRGEDGGATRFDPARFTADVIAALR